MTDRAPDPRTARTVASLRNALRVQLRDRSLDESSVSGLCRIAGVRRTTFYTHYSSPSDLLTEMLTSEVDTLLDLQLGADRGTAAVSREFQTTLVAAFEHITRERPLFRAAFDSGTGAPVRRALLAMFARRVGVALRIWDGIGAPVPATDSAATAFCAGGLTSSVEAWAMSDRTDARAWADDVRDQMPPWWPRG